MAKIRGQHRATSKLQGYLNFAFDQREIEVNLHKATSSLWKINVIKDNDGRFLICTVVINQEKIVLTNYYGLNSDEIYLLKNWCNELEQLNDMWERLESCFRK